MIKLECLRSLIGKNTKLKKDFKVIMDSNLACENSLFFAINNGNKYAKDAEEKGSFVIYDDKNLKIKNGFYVKDTVKFMQDFAKLYRKEKAFIVIGVTGSNGKTTVKDIIYSLLKDKTSVYKTQGNYNNHIGLPFTILSAHDSDKILVLEMGMSNLGEIDLLANIAKPDYSIITNIGQSHLEFLKTEENVFKAKCEIIKHSKITYVNGEDKYLKTLNSKNIIQVMPENIISNLKGKHNQINLSLANALLKQMAYENLDFSNISLSPGRFEIIEKEHVYINDAYNASPLSMRASIETFSNMYNDCFKVICLGDMKELGDNEIKFHEDLSDVLISSKFDLLMLYGEKMKYLYIKLRKIYMDNLAQNIETKFNFMYYSDKNELKKDIEKIKSNKKLAILLKASRSMKMEEII